MRTRKALQILQIAIKLLLSNRQLVMKTLTTHHYSKRQNRIGMHRKFINFHLGFCCQN